MYFFNMDLLLIMKLTGINTAKHVVETHLEGMVSRLCFISCRRVNLKTIQIITKVTRCLL